MKPLLLACALAALAVACGKEDRAQKGASTSQAPDAPQAGSPASPGITFTPLPATEAPASVPQAAAPPAPAVKVEGLALGKAIGADKRVQGAPGTFAPNDVVYLSVETSAGDATLKSRWTYHKDGKATVVKEESQRVPPGGPATLAFHAERPGGWARGDYQVEVFVNGESAGRQRFTVS